MRHGKKFNHLGRKAPHRKAMLANMACSLIQYKRIKTTVAKAKALRMYIEPLLTKSKSDTTHSRRTVFSYLKQKEAITELFGDVASKITNRPGGYTRILKISNRLGDNAEMCFIELVDYNEEYTTDKPKRKKTRRRGAKSDEDQIVEGSTKEVVEETIEATEDNKEGEAADVIEEEPVKEAEEVKDEVEQPVEEIPSVEAKEEVSDTKEDAVEENPSEAEEVNKANQEEINKDDPNSLNEEEKKEE